MSRTWHRATRKPDGVLTTSRNSPDAAVTGSQEAPRTDHPSKIVLAIVPAALMVLAGAVIFSGFGLGYWTPLGPGPGFFPFWIGLVLAISSAVWLVQMLRGNPNVGPKHAEPGVLNTENVKVTRTAKKRPLWTILLSLVIMASLLDVLGFQLTMFAFLLFQLKFQGGRKWLESLIIALIGSFGIFYLFTQVLQVTLPTSGIDFLEDLGL